MIDTELIRKFLKNQCTDAEAGFIHEYFKENPEEIGRYIPLEDLLAAGTGQLDKTISKRMLGRIREAYRPVKQRSIGRYIMRYAAAASVIGLAVLVSMHFFSATADKTAKLTIAMNQNAGNRQALEKTENKTADIMQFRLSDSSVVVLYPKSSLEYLPGFEKNSRNLYLKGKATFNVRKQATKPFTVYAGGIATTALGTQFLVSDMDSPKVSVILMEGSVKVQSQYSLDNSEFVVLRPGDKLLLYGRQFSNYSLTHGITDNQRRELAKIKTEASIDQKNSLVFKNVSLKNVFRNLEEKFAVTINYEKVPGIQKKLFTGTLLEKDSLGFIIKTICELHGLQYSVDSNIITISKP